MSTPAQIRAQLRAAVVAAIRGDGADRDAAQAWLMSMTAHDLLRVDGLARRWSYGGPPLGESQEWTRRVLSSTRLAPALASMHPDGFLRERAVAALAQVPDPLGSRMLAVRVADHVERVRERALREVARRTDLVDADQVAPVLQRFEVRSRGAEARSFYLGELELRHGEQRVWAHLRESGDRDLRRVAFRHSIGAHLLGLDDAVHHLERDRDQVVRRLMANLVAETADTGVLRSVLLRSRVAEARVLGLVRLGRDELSDDDVGSLLADSSVLVRFWARRRWAERGGDPVEAYRSLLGSGLTATRRANAYLGLAEAGAAIPRDEVLDLVRSSEVPLRKIGLRLLTDRAEASDTDLLLRLVAGEHSRVARLAIDVLAANLGIWQLSQLEALERAHDPELRRRGWLLHRSRRGWESVIADLQVMRDPDPHLAQMGRQPVAPMYALPDDRQAKLIDDLLRTSPLKRDLRLRIAHAARLGHLVDELRQPSPDRSRTPAAPARTPVTAPPRPASVWRRLLGRGGQ